ncbi:37565_t:CDS:2 [Gigaspora margarita]|uniref:37565_t:CDS:1 n=1 Tax=Gigaspora margarita TaxID=4874 RepID=A0ABN7VTH8_GIGMA|nr:37565_t:CDS:2 [Gigaspora margarita]
MKQYFGGRAPHRLIPYVEVLQTRINKVNKAAVCKACINKLGREIALERSIFTNTKACTKAHFKKYKTKSCSIQHLKSRPSKDLINNYLIQDLNPAEYIVFERHILKSTISSEFAFRWTEDPEIVALFKFLNPNLKLPSRRALSGRILTLYNEELQRQYIVEAKKHKIDNTLIFNGWKNAHFQEILGSILVTSKGKVLVWGAEDILVKAEINYKRTIEAAKSLEQNVSSNINTIFGSDNCKYKQLNSDKLVEQGSSNVEQESSSVEKESPIIELETIENEKMIIDDDDSDSSANEDINDEWKSVLKEWSKDLISEEESVDEVERLFFEIEKTEDLSSNELLVGLSHLADDSKEK